MRSTHRLCPDVDDSACVHLQKYYGRESVCAYLGLPASPQLLIDSFWKLEDIVSQSPIDLACPKDVLDIVEHVIAPAECTQRFRSQLAELPMRHRDHDHIVAAARK
jgi:hypothetical protein